MVITQLSYLGTPTVQQTLEASCKMWKLNEFDMVIWPFKGDLSRTHWDSSRKNMDYISSWIS